MRRKIVAVWISMVMLLGFIVIVVDVDLPAKAATITVDDSGGANYNKIQDAINAANPGDTIFVYSGTYYENVLVNKRVFITGENRDTTIVDGSDAGHGFHIAANGVGIINFVLDHCKGSDNKAIFIESSNNAYIRNIHIKNSWFGIYLRDTTENQIQSCYLYRTWSTSFMMYNASYTVVRDITTTSSDFGDGIRLYQSSNNLVDNCNSQYHWCGITMALGSSNNTIVYNYVYENDFGIDVYWESNDNVILYNFAERNEYNSISDGDGLGIGDDCTGNLVHHNNFKFNYFSSDKQGWDYNGNNQWDDGTEGNWWNDWITPDDDSNGIVDLPYTLGSTEDRFPLVNQLSQYPPHIALVKAIPENQVQDEDLNITAQVTDDNLVSDVYINITSPTNISTNLSMIFDPLNKIAYLNNIYSEVGLYNFVIWAMDDGGRVVKYEGQFNIMQRPIRIDSNLDFDVDHGVTRGNGSKDNPWIIENHEIYGNGFGYCLYIGNTTDYFIVQNCSLQNARGVWSWPYFPDSGLILYNVQNGKAENNNISSNYNGAHLYNTNNNIILNNTFFSNDEYGIIIYYSNTNYIENNSIIYNNCAISLTSSEGIEITNNTLMQNGIAIYGNNLENWNTHQIDNSNKVNAKPIIYWKNQTSGSIPVGAGQIILANCSNVKVENQNISFSTVGISLGFSSNITLINNTLNSNEYYGINIFESQENYISFNKIMKSDSGLRLALSENNNISENTISLNIWMGVILDMSKYNLIFNNEVSGNNEFGIRLLDSTYNEISGNTLKSNKEYGIYLDTSNNNNVTNNNVSTNEWYGIYSWLSSNNNFIGNIISDNNEGICLQSSSYNYVYHNNIINNTIQAYDDGTNFWNNTYPFGGNYWSDYDGNDEYSGPNQDIPGKDGIGDTNYSLDLDSIDYYPLIGPYPDFPTENYSILLQGWNFISVPLIQEDSNLEEVLERIDGIYDAIQRYDNYDEADPWRHHKIGKPFGNNLYELNESMGFWIHITQPGDTIFVYNGTQPTSNQTIQLYKGWNMVGYPSLTSYNRTTGLNNLEFDTDVDCIQWYDAATKTWHFMGPDDSFVPGRGYWVHSKVEAEWEVPL